MVAATIFLDGGVTLGAFLCVRRYPVGSLRIVLTFLKPFLDNSARRRLVIVESATEAEMVTAATVNGWNDTGKITIFDLTVDCINTVWCRAPFEILKVINVGSSE
jgi:hypothetical protein